ncbi:MAG: hypothetical protein ACK4J0_02865 [Candidatus Anstonellaceae archaeon]
MFFEGEKKKEKVNTKIEKNKELVVFFSQKVKNYLELVGMDQDKAKDIIEKNKDRIFFIYNKLKESRGKEVGDKKKLSYVKGEVSDQTIMDYVVIAVINEKVFLIEAELMLGIATQESNLINPPKKTDGRGPFQITLSTYLDLGERFFNIMTNFKEIEILNNQDKRNILYSKLFNAFKKDVPTDIPTQFVLASLILQSKRLSVKNGKKKVIEFEPNNYKTILERYNGHKKHKKRYAQEVLERIKYLKIEGYGVQIKKSGIESGD